MPSLQMMPQYPPTPLPTPAQAAEQHMALCLTPKSSQATQDLPFQAAASGDKAAAGGPAPDTADADWSPDSPPGQKAGGRRRSKLSVVRLAVAALCSFCLLFGL